MSKGPATSAPKLSIRGPGPSAFSSTTCGGGSRRVVTASVGFAPAASKRCAASAADNLPSDDGAGGSTGAAGGCADGTGPADDRCVGPSARWAAPDWLEGTSARRSAVRNWADDGGADCARELGCTRRTDDLWTGAPNGTPIGVSAEGQVARTSWLSKSAASGFGATGSVPVAAGMSRALGLIVDKTANLAARGSV